MVKNIRIMVCTGSMAAGIEWEGDEGDFWNENNILIGIWVVKTL